MAKKDPSKIDQLLDLLLDALQERQAARDAEAPRRARPPARKTLAQAAPESTSLPTPPSEPVEPADDDHGGPPEVSVVPEKLPSIQLDRLLGRLAVALLAFTILVNIPFNRFGTSLARAMPDEKALIIRDGLVLKGPGEEIFVLENNHKRWISSLDAFDYYGYRWAQVNLVDEDFLAQFPDGPALSILYKCATSPHVFAIENGVRRWIKDIPTFEAQGYIWDDVQIVPCATIERIPSGPPIPPDAGEPPPP